MSFPTSIDSFTDPSPKTPTNSASVPLSTAIARLNAAVSAIEATVGITGSADPTSIENRLSAVVGQGGAVTSVAGRTGDVTLAVGDVTDAVDTADARLSDARTPTTHASSHAHGGSDVLTASAIGAKPQTGFLDRTSSSLGMSGSSFQVTTGTSYDIYSGGTKYTKSTTQSVSISNDLTLHYVYFDTSGVLQVATSAWDISSDNVPVATVYKDGSIYVIGDERHSAYRDKMLHAMLDSTVGARYDQSYGGLTGTFTNTTLSVTRGRIYDEDILNDTGGTKTTANLYYRNTGLTAMRVELSSSTPYKAAAGIISYDNAGTLAGASTNNYVNYWLYATNDITNPLAIVVGQSQSSNLSTIRSEALPVVLLSTLEWKLLYRLTYRNANGVATYIENADYRTSSSLPSGGAPASNASSVTFAASGNVAATNVQAAIEEVDAEKLAATASAAGTLIAGASQKTTLIAADKFAISDSAATDVLKHASPDDIATYLYTLGFPRVFWQSGIPLMIIGGDGGSNGLSFTGTRGQFSLSAAILSSLYNNLTGFYQYLPAGAGGLSNAGWYWTTMSNDTTGEVFQETYNPGSGIPQYVASPTQQPNLSAGRITQSTSEVTAASFTIPGGAMGANGMLRCLMKFMSNNSAGTKTIRSKYSSANVLCMQNTTNFLDSDLEGVRQNAGVATKQIGVRTTSGYIGYNVSTYSQDASAIDTTVDQTFSSTLQLGTNSDSAGMILRIVESRYKS